MEGLARAYDGRPALAGIDLEVRPGELMTVLGPSGSGKSTLLRLIAGLDRADAGRVRVGGRDVSDLPPARRDVGMLFQSFALFPHLSVERNIGFGLEARGVGAAERRRAVGEAAERLGLGGMLDRRPGELSGGERQRVALARALVRRPAVLLLDEPLSNLDAALRAQARSLIRELQAAESMTTVYVTHDQDEALVLGHRVAVLEQGRVAQVGVPAEVYDRPVDVFVAGFLGRPPMNLVPAQVVDGVARAGSLRVPVADAPAAGVTVGFRPEHVQVGARGGFPARVVAVERAGHEVVCDLDAGGVRIRARPAAGTAAPRPGEEAEVSVDPAGIRLFDPVTGRAR